MDWAIGLVAAGIAIFLIVRYREAVMGVTIMFIAAVAPGLLDKKPRR